MNIYPPTINCSVTVAGGIAYQLLFYTAFCMWVGLHGWGFCYQTSGPVAGAHNIMQCNYIAHHTMQIISNII